MKSVIVAARRSPNAVPRARGREATNTIVVMGLGEHVLLPEVDVAFETSGTPARIASCLMAVRRGGGVLVRIPAPGPMSTPPRPAVRREIDVDGSFRYGARFALVLTAIVDGAPTDALPSVIFGLNSSQSALALAADRRHALKVQLDLRAP